jgi:V-type H+-transporting ATPase subunit C
VGGADYIGFLELILLFVKGPLVRWLKINFSEAYTAWIHVKALRVFVESVLRYGLPVNFQACVIKPQKKNAKKIRDQLEHLFSGLNADAGGHHKNSKQVDALVEAMPGMLGADNYYSYVFFNLNLEFAESGSKN